MPGKKALVVWGGWDGHAPKATVDIFAPLLADAGFDVQLENSLACYSDAERLKAMDLIVQCWTMGQLEKEQCIGLCSAVASGTGLAGWHGGIIDAFRNDTGYQFMTGGQFVAHPGGRIPSYRVTIALPNHPIVKGLSNFEMRDTEQYYIHYDPGVEVLCQTTFTGEHGKQNHFRPGTVMPYAYTRGYGQGRIFVAGWGHSAKDFEIPEAREIVRRGLLWAAR